MTADDDREVTKPSVPDLHTALEAAITARLGVARAATPGPWTWTGDYPDGHCPHGSEWTDHGPDLCAGKEFVITSSGYDASGLYITDADAAHIALHDPADAVRRYERDLKVLKRHAPIAAPHLGAVLICSYEWADGDGWDVLWAEHPPIADLLDVYPEVPR